MAAKRKRSPTPSTGHYAYEGLDRVLHEKARLGILTALASRPDGIRFTELKDMCSLTDGNLSRHVQVLHDSDLVEVWKGYEGKRPQTLVRLSAAGRKEFLSYIEELERVIDDARSESSRARKWKGFDAPPGWVPA